MVASAATTTAAASSKRGQWAAVSWGQCSPASNKSRGIGWLTCDLGHLMVTYQLYICNISLQWCNGQYLAALHRSLIGSEVYTFAGICTTVWIHYLKHYAQSTKLPQN